MLNPIVFSSMTPSIPVPPPGVSREISSSSSSLHPQNASSSSSLYPQKALPPAASLWEKLMEEIAFSSGKNEASTQITGQIIGSIP
jgi:hypothetical protein